MKTTYDPRPRPLGRLGNLAERTAAHLLKLLLAVLPRTRH
jgi:hypothetical protein